MNIIEVKLPAMGEGITDATITKWLVGEGEMVEIDTPIVEVATDKVDSEIPSPVDGKVVKILLKEGDIPKVGQVLAVIEVETTSVQTQSATTISAEQATSSISKETSIINGAGSQNKVHTEQEIRIPSRLKNGTFVPPLVRKIAEEEGLTSADLEAINGSGADGKLTKNDVLGFLQKDKQQPQKIITTTTTALSTDNINIFEMDRLRKITAQHMTQSKQTSAHVTSFIEVDLTAIVTWREKNKQKFEQVNSEKLTFTPFFFSAVSDAIKAYPLINSSVDGDKILVKKDINIGMATALPNDNLIVPVIRNADRLNLAGLAHAVNDLARRARSFKLQPADIQGGTFTISNLGAFDNLAGTPIINQPQVAILAVGAIKKRPVVIETPAGDTIGIRHISILSLTFDHRIIDGALGGNFLKQIAANLEGFKLAGI